VSNPHGRGWRGIEIVNYGEAYPIGLFFGEQLPLYANEGRGMNYCETYAIIREFRAYESLHQLQTLGSGCQYHTLYKLVGSMPLAGKTALDWGCGNGHFSLFLLHYMPVVSACDFIMPEAFASKTGVDFVAIDKADASAMPYQDNYFDYVFSVGVLEHVREYGGDDLASLGEICRILKPGGSFVCYHLPNKYSLVDFLVNTFMKGKRHHHQFRYTVNDIRRLCAKQDLEIIKIKRYGLLPKLIWNNLPGVISNNPVLIYCYCVLDDCLSLLFNIVATNYLFVARKYSGNPEIIIPDADGR
jgi:ubiquinone/menaquinone biosynthesis C-methylase UbiE